MANSTNKICLVAASVVTALGSSSEELWNGLLDGETAVEKITRFDTSKLPYHDGAYAKWLDKASGLNPVCALTDKALEGLTRVPTDAFPIWAGIKGDAPYIEGFYEKSGAEPEYLPSHFRERVRKRFDLKKKGLDVNAACASSTVALALGAGMISEGSASSVLVVAADVLGKFIFTGFAALRGLTPTVCRPFDSSRDGLVLGDGAAAILLMESKEAEKRGIEPLAMISGWGIANDANHITGPAKDGRGLIKAVTSAVTSAGLQFDEVEAFCAHGTGTSYNDAMELTAMNTVFGGRSFPAFSVKGAIGHTLGAAGAIEAVISAHALKEKKVPPTSGFQNPDPLDTGRISNKPQPFGGENILTSNSGFGGCNAALVLERFS